MFAGFRVLYAVPVFRSAIAINILLWLLLPNNLLIFRPFRNSGCGGGLMDWAFKWMVDNGGIDTEDDWGYYSGWGFGTWCNARKQKDR